jgi:decaprenylphospho-beta-D-ribofuranose 2-oxidase
VRASRVESLSGWGRYPSATCRFSAPSDTDEVLKAVEGLPKLIARGNGRSYGDASLGAADVLSIRGLDRFLQLTQDGVLTCEAGVLLSDVIDVVLPRGWYPPVTPGTKLVTIGGMIAADVHGKNHHVAGSFGEHLRSFDIALADGSIAHCSRDDNADLFAATCGGMGLTGIILRASFQLVKVQTAKIRQRVIRAANLDEAIEVFEENLGATYSVAWIDGFGHGSDVGRSVVFLGEHAALDELPEPGRAAPFARPGERTLAVPFDLPGLALSRPIVRTFNSVYFHSHDPGESLVDLDAYFYPLDSIHDWNRLYGRRGFVQYQPVLPIAEARAGLRRLLSEVAKSGQASFLAVLKRMGPQSFGMMSFPMLGYTVTLDFPATTSNLALLDRLDAIVAEHGGRLYLAKDARMSPSAAAAGYPLMEAFVQLRERLGLRPKFSSQQSERLGL